MSDSENTNNIARQPDGKWAPGMTGNPNGRPPRAVEDLYADTRKAVLAVMNEAVSLEDWREIIIKAVADAKLGSWRARQFLANYLIGAPPELDASSPRPVLVSLSINRADGQPDNVQLLSGDATALNAGMLADAYNFEIERVEPRPAPAVVTQPEDAVNGDH